MGRIDIEKKNPALLLLIDDYSQIIPLDACVLIPPDRSREMFFPICIASIPHY